MAATQNAQYLESRVLTAPSYRLHLMLIEGAIRFGRQAESLLKRGETMDAGLPLLRVIDIVGELLAGVRAHDSDLNKNLTDFYVYLFRTVTAAKINDDPAKLAEALKLLEFERQTWQLVCDKLASETDQSPTRQDSPVGQVPRPAMMPSLYGNGAPATTFGLSLEA